MKIIATIEARMTSSRLPGKHLLEANGKPMIEHLIHRLKKVSSLDEIVMATTVNDTDQPLVSLSEALGISCFRGSEDDVMSRVIGAAESVKGDLIVEISGDCPIIDPALIEQTIQVFLKNKCDYVNNAEFPTYPDGMNTQVFSLEALKRSYAMTDDPEDREHVTLHIRNHPEIFRPVFLVAPPNLHWSDLELTLDEKEDYELLKKIIEHFGDNNPYFTCEETIQLLKEKTEWVQINKNVTRTWK